MDLPGRLGGRDPLVDWLNKLREAVAECRVASVIGGEFTRGSAGTHLRIYPGVSAASVKPVAYKTVGYQDDFIRAKLYNWSDNSMTDPEVQIAKPWLLRCSRTEETVEDTDYEFTYATTSPGSASNKIRSKQELDGNGDPVGTAEEEMVTPLWQQGEIVWAVPCDTTGVSHTDENNVTRPVTLILVCDSRAWAMVYDNPD